MEADFNDRPVGADDVAIIGLVDMARHDCFVPIAETRAWNWQQGAMAQWAPAAADRLIVYNDRQHHRLVAVVLDIRTRERRVMPLPVYAVSPDGQYALSVSFARVRYYYAGIADPWGDDPIPKEDGIHWMDLTTGAYRLILTYTQVAAFDPMPAMGGGKHWIEHLMINPDSNRFLFLHRFPLADGGFCSRLLTANPDGSDLCVLADGMVSHLCWRDSRQILAWSRRSNLVRRARHRGLFARPFFRWALAWARQQEGGWVRQRVIGDRFFLFSDRTREAAPVGVGVLADDGHCSYSPDRQWILTDTYPDQNQERTLILYHPDTRRRFDIGKYYSPVLAGATRCDLHPRWDRDGRKVCIDSMHEGSRQIYVVDVEDIITRRGGD